jgi:hypothetical protein
MHACMHTYIHTLSFYHITHLTYPRSKSRAWPENLREAKTRITQGDTRGLPGFYLGKLVKTGDFTEFPPSNRQTFRIHDGFPHVLTIESWTRWSKKLTRNLNFHWGQEDYFLAGYGHQCGLYIKFLGGVELWPRLTNWFLGASKGTISGTWNGV